MGIESFRIEMLLEKTISIGSVIDAISSQYLVEPVIIKFRKGLFLHKEIMENNYFVDNTMKIYFNEDNNFYNYLSLESCYSNYEYNISLTYKIYKIIQQLCNVKVKLKEEINPKYQNVQEEEYKRIVTDFYKQNYKYFCVKYKIFNTKILPDETFYKTIRKHKLKD